MAKYENPAELDYRNGGDTVDDFAQKYMRTVDYIIKALNDLRTPTGNSAGVEPEPYMWRIADNKLYIRNGDNTDYVLLGEISPNFGFRQSVNDRFLTTADLEGDGAVVTRNEAGKVEGDITGSPGKIAGKTIDVTPTADNDVIAYDAAQQKWVKKTLNDYLKKQGDAGWDEMVDEVADQVIEDITPVIFNFWYLDEYGYLVPLVGSTEGGLPSIHGMVGDYEQITARSVEVAGNINATGNVTAGMLTTPQANVTTLTANEVNAGMVTANDVIAKGPVVDVRAFGAKGDGVHDDTAAIQAAIDYSFANGFPAVLIPPGTYLLTDTIHIGGAFQKPYLMGVNARTCVFTYPNFTEDKPAILYTGGSGSEGNYIVENLTFAGTGKLARAVQVQETNGLTVRNCQFTGNKVAYYLYNDAAGHFAEYDRLERCCIWGGTAIEYAKASEGDASFHGSGLIDCSINTESNQSVSSVIVNSGCLPYNSPLDFSIWTKNDTPIINNMNSRATFYGTIRIEPISQVTARVCNGATKLVGNIMSNYPIDFTDLYLMDSIVMHPDGNDERLDTMYKPKCYSGTLEATTETQPLITSNLLVQALTKIYVSLSAPNFERVYEITSVKRNYADVWEIHANVLHDFNVAGIGTVNFTQTVGGRIDVTLPTAVSISYKAVVEKLLFKI